MFDREAVTALLRAAARGGTTLSYSEALLHLGFNFSRPKMRALCKLLDDIDAAGRARGEPELAVLVVRESDRIPGQGWWVGRAAQDGYTGQWEGPQARAHVEALQRDVFAYWAGR